MYRQHFCCLVSLSHNHIQDLFGKSDDDPASQGQKPIGPLAWVMRFQRQSDLHNTKAQQNQTNGSDQAENEIGQVVHYANWISSRIADACANGKAHEKKHL